MENKAILASLLAVQRELKVVKEEDKGIRRGRECGGSGEENMGKKHRQQTEK